ICSSRKEAQAVEALTRNVVKAAIAKSKSDEPSDLRVDLEVSDRAVFLPRPVGVRPLRTENHIAWAQLISADLDETRASHHHERMPCACLHGDALARCHHKLIISGHVELPDVRHRFQRRLASH